MKFEHTLRMFSFKPTKLDATAKDYYIELILTDSFGESNSYSFVVTITDDPV
jgi:hypothetical protein